MKKWAGLLLAFLLLLGATASAAVRIGDRAEDFSIVNSDGTVSTLSLMLAQKKAVYVYFWASWCGPCRMLSPVIEEIAAENPNLKVGSVNVDEQPELAAQVDIRFADAVGIERDQLVAGGRRDRVGDIRGLPGLGVVFVGDDGRRIGDLIGPGA